MTLSDAHEGEPTAAGEPREGSVTPSARTGGRTRGPQTPHGKARVGRNAIVHGITAAVPVIPGVECLEDWEAHRRGVAESLQPVGRLETVLAERVASVLWRLHRVVAYERDQLAKASDAWLLPETDLNAIMRYEAHLSRQVYRALHAVQVLQAHRRGDPVALAQVQVHGLPEA